jgi:ABC-2 type transport system permease protein
MEITVPSTSSVLRALLRADFTTQWRNRRSFVLVLAVPVIILLTWKSYVATFGAAFVLANGITIALVAIGLMGYTNSIARDRDKGIFQRLRVGPIPSWSIMGSRLIVQLAMIMLVTLIVFIGGDNFDGIVLSPAGYALTVLTAFIGGAVYLGLGQVIVGLIKNPETVNSTSRLIYITFIVVGMIGQFGAFGEIPKQIVLWSPYGTVNRMVAAGMNPSTWNKDASEALLLTVLYATVFSVIGIKKFQWNSGR